MLKWSIRQHGTLPPGQPSRWDNARLTWLIRSGLRRTRAIYTQPFEETRENVCVCHHQQVPGLYLF